MPPASLKELPKSLRIVFNEEQWDRFSKGESAISTNDIEFLYLNHIYYRLLNNMANKHYYHFHLFEEQRTKDFIIATIHTIVSAADILMRRADEKKERCVNFQRRRV